MERVGERRVGRPGDNERGTKILYIVPEFGDEVIAYDATGTFEDLLNYMESQNGIFATSIESFGGYEMDFDTPLVELGEYSPIYVYMNEEIIYSVR